MRCENHGVPTIVLPSVNLKYRLVFFSPDLYAQTREALRRVEVAVSACRNLVERYHAQGRLQEEQEAQALAQDQAELAAAELALFSARISEYRDLEYCSNQHQGEKLKKCQEMLRIPRWVVKGSDIPVDEKNEKALHVVYSSLRSDAIYSRAKLAKIGRQVLEEEFVRQSKELSLALEGAIIEFSRTLLSLKQSARDVRPRKRITGKEMFWAQVESGSPVNRDQLVLLYRN